MRKPFVAVSANIILYCRNWSACVDFYDKLGFERCFSNAWLVEFRLNAGACLSVADESRCRIKSSAGHGLTVTLQVNDLENIWQYLQELGCAPQAIESVWNARRFFVFDPEGNRLEFWEPQPG